MHQVFEESEPDSRLLTELTPLLGLATVSVLGMVCAVLHALSPLRAMIPANSQAVGGWVATLVPARLALRCAALGLT